MLEYLLIALYILWLIYKYDFCKFKFPYRNLHICFLCIIFILLAGLSYRLGVDTIRYEYYFNDVYPTINNFSLMPLAYYALFGDPGWVIFNGLCKLIMDEFFVVKILTAAIFNITVFWFCRKYARFFFTAIFIYYILNFFNYNFQVLRESIAISFFLIALDKLLGDKPSYFKYYLFLAPTLLFHTFGFITLFFPLIFRIKGKNIKRHLLLIILITPLLPVLIKTVLSLGPIPSSVVDKLTGKYLVNENYSSDAINIFGILQRLIIAFSALFIVYSTRRIGDKRFFPFAIFYSYIMILLLGFPIMVRVSNYMFIPFAVYISDTIITYKNNMKRTLIFILFIFSYSHMYLMSETMWRQYIPYSSIITKKVDIKREQIMREIMYDE